MGGCADMPSTSGAGPERAAPSGADGRAGDDAHPPAHSQRGPEDTPRRALSNTACRARQARAQDAWPRPHRGLLLTTPAEFTYFTGYLTRFGKPVAPLVPAVARRGPCGRRDPAIGAVLMAQCAVDDPHGRPRWRGRGPAPLTEAIVEVPDRGQLRSPWAGRCAEGWLFCLGSAAQAF